MTPAGRPPGRRADRLSGRVEQSWLHKELLQAKNFKQWFKKGRTTATLMTGIEQWLLPKLGIRNPPWTIHRTKPDHVYLKPAAECEKIVYPKPDGKLTFDRLSSVFISNTNHEENQPAHLTLKDASVPVNVNWEKFAGPESRYCPAACTSSCRTRPRARNACRSMRRTACTARPAISRTRRRTSCGSRRKAAAVRTTWACKGLRPAVGRVSSPPKKERGTFGCLSLLAFTGASAPRAQSAAGQKLLVDKALEQGHLALAQHIEGNAECRELASASSPVTARTQASAMTSLSSDAVRRRKRSCTRLPMAGAARPPAPAPRRY